MTNKKNQDILVLGQLKKLVHLSYKYQIIDYFGFDWFEVFFIPENVTLTKYIFRILPASMILKDIQHRCLEISSILVNKMNVIVPDDKYPCFT